MQAAAAHNQALPIGHKLQGYEIRKVLSYGGFSFVYIAHDEDKVAVAIKEYLPISLALRAEGTNVRVNSEESSK